MNTLQHHPLIQHKESMWGRINPFGGQAQNGPNPNPEPTPPPNPDPNAGQEQEQEQTQDNQDNLDPWQRPAQDGNQRTQQPPPPPQGNQPTLDDYINSHNFTGNIDQTALAGALEQNDMKAVAAEFQKMGAAVFKQAIQDAGRLIQSAEKRMEDSTKTYVQGNQDATAVMTQLQTEVPLAREARFEPIFRATLLGFMQQGDDPVTAIQKTKRYTDEFVKAAGGGQQTNRPGQNGPGGFGTAPFPPNAGPNTNQPDNSWLEDLL